MSERKEWRPEDWPEGSRRDEWDASLAEPEQPVAVPLRAALLKLRDVAEAGLAGPPSMDESRWGVATLLIDAALAVEAVRPETGASARDEPGIDERWLLFFEDPRHEVETFVGAGATEAAWRRHEQASQAWTCTLFRAVTPPIDQHTVRATPLAERP